MSDRSRCNAMGAGADRRPPAAHGSRRHLLARCLLLSALLGLGCDSDDIDAVTLDRGETAYLAGLEALHLGEYHEAERRFQESYTLGAKRDESLRWRIQVLLNLGRLTEARAAADRRAKLRTTDPDAHAMVVQIDLLMGDYAAAWRDLRRLAKGWPDTALVLRLEAELFLALGYADRAERAILAGEALSLPDADSETWSWHMAKVDLLRGWLELARHVHKQLGQGSALTDDRLRMAFLHHQLGEIELADHAYRRALELAPRDRTHTDPMVLSLAADFHASIGLLADAVDELVALRDVLVPGPPDITRRIASVRIRQGRHAEAQAHLRPYIQAQPNDRSSIRDLALSYLNDGRADGRAKGQGEDGLPYHAMQAIGLLEPLIGTRSLAPENHYLLGVARLAARETTRARAALEEARRLGHDTRELRLAIAALCLREKSWFEAGFEARKLLELDRRDLLAGIIWVTTLRFNLDEKAAWLGRRRLLRLHPRRASTIRKLIPLDRSARQTPGDPPSVSPDLLDKVFGRRSR